MKKIFSVSMLIVILLGIAIGSVSCRVMETDDWPSIDNVLEDTYTVTEAEYDMATYGDGPILKPKVENLKTSVSRKH
jgi:hypothetical protein